MENERPTGQPQRSNSEQLLRASTFGTEFDLSLGTTQSASFPFIPGSEKENAFIPAAPDADLSGMAKSRYQTWDEQDRPTSGVGDFLDDVSDSEVEVVIDDDSDSDSSAQFDEFDERSTAGISLPNKLLRDRLKKDVFNIIRSQITNYGNEGGDVEIRLTCGQEMQTGDPLNIFRWCHFHNDVMDLDNFIEQVLRASPLSSGDRRMLKQGLSGVRVKYERATWTQDATVARYLDPFVFHEFSQPASTRPGLDRKVTILCFPYFLLDEPPRQIESLSHTSHPPQTLLQTLSSSIALERDMQQVVSGGAEGQKTRCFHVSQLWGVVLDDRFLYTCARLPGPKFFGDAVTLITAPTLGFPYIKVTDGGNCTWHLGLKDCETWFGFTAHFMDIGINQLEVARTFDDLYDVTLDGNTIKRDRWAELLDKARSSPLHLVLTRRTQAERVERIQGPNANDALDTTHGISFNSPKKTTNNSVSLSAHDSTDSRPLAAIPLPTHPVTQDSNYNSGNNAKDGSTTNIESQKKDINQNTSTISLDEKFHAFVWYTVASQKSRDATQPGTKQSTNQQSQDLSAFLERMNERLLKRGHRKDKKAYRDSERKTLPEVTLHLLLVTRDTNQTDGYIDRLSTLDTFFVAAVQIFELFLDLKNDSEVAQRYWGAVLYIMKVVLVEREWTQHSEKTIDIFKRISYLATMITGELSPPHGPHPGSFALPQHFGRAFIHCLHLLTLFRSGSAYTSDREQHAEKCEVLLLHARQLVWRSWTRIPLHRKEVASPLALLSVMINQLQKDIGRFDERPNIAHIYREYWKNLVIDVNSGRLKRSMPKFDPLQQEIEAVLKILEHQVDMLTRLCRTIEIQSTGWSSFHSRHLQNAPRPEVPMLQDCITHVVDRIQLFRTIMDDSKRLEKWTDEHLTAFTKDRHDNAIYVFTIFTVIFLPLSFVCSFLGMNTADVRDTKYGQSIFWAAALPLTFIVVLIALLVTDELGEVWITLKDKLGLKSTKFGLTRRREPSSYWRRTSGAQEMLNNISERKRPLKARKTNLVPMAETPSSSKKTKEINVKMLNQRAPTFGSAMV